MIDTSAIRDRFSALAPHLDERARRSFAAAEARSAGYGGIAAVARATGIAPSTIGRGLAELSDTAPLPVHRNRRAGGGRKPLTQNDPALIKDLLALVDTSTRGDPMSALRWTCKSLRRLAAELRLMGHQISHTVVGELLKAQKQVARIALGRCGSFSYDQRAGDRRLVGDVHALGKNLNFLKLCL